MERQASEKNNIQSVIYHANILNYDKQFFTDIITKGLKLDYTKISETLSRPEDKDNVIKFLNQSPKEQIALINSAFQEEDGSLPPEENSANANEEKKIRKTTANNLTFLLNLLNFSKIQLVKDRTNNAGNVPTRSPEGDNISYILLYLDGLLMINIDFIKLLEGKLQRLATEKLQPLLLSLLQEPSIDNNSKEIASHILSVSLMYSENKEIINHITTLIEWTFKHCIEMNRGNCLTSNLSLLLTNDECVKYFISTFEIQNQCIRKLYEYMVNETNINLIYESLFCLWNISNSKENISLFENKIEKHLEKIVQVIRTNKIDKVARIGLMIIQNVKESETCMEILFNIKFMRTIDILLTNKWNDQSIKEMLHIIYDYLEKNYKLMNSFEKYTKELDSGDLKQGSLHTTAFWEDNYRDFEYNKFEYIRRLVEIIKYEKSGEEDIERKSIACFDIGEFARLYPGGSGILEIYKAKDSLLLLIQHKNIDLKNRALVCLQKIMMRSLNK